MNILKITQSSLFYAFLILLFTIYFIIFFYLSLDKINNFQESEIKSQFDKFENEKIMKILI